MSSARGEVCDPPNQRAQCNAGYKCASNCKSCVCAPTCGDGTCATACGETAANCVADCGYCGDGNCYGSETCTSCVQDCACSCNTDNDGLTDCVDACPTTYGTDCHGCPAASCPTCQYSTCPPSGPPTCAPASSSTSCGSKTCTELSTTCATYGTYPQSCNGAGSCNIVDCTTVAPTSYASAGTSCSSPSGGVCDGAGACGCPTGKNNCNGACVDTTSDASNCGSCGTNCGGQACINSKCAVCTSASQCDDQNVCTNDGCGTDGKCTHTNNAASCSSPSGGTCSNGACACPSGKSNCDGVCVDKLTDPNNCGACNNACGSGVCVNGACSACVATTEVCDGADNDCDTQIDEGLSQSQACTVGVGACARNGTQTQTCANGAWSEWTICSATPGTAGTETCNNVDDDCDGSVDECPGSQVCINGACTEQQCSASHPCAEKPCNTAMCNNGKCVYTAKDDGTSCTGGHCVDGECKKDCPSPYFCSANPIANAVTQQYYCAQGTCYGCSNGYAHCGNACINTNADPNNCGQCNNKCPSTKPRCSNGACVACTTMNDCDDNNVCTDDACSNGACTHTNNQAGCVINGRAGTCANGACVPAPVCTEGAKQCQNGILRTCIDGEWQSQPCPSGTCADSASCLAQGCSQDNECDDNNPCTADFCGCEGSVCDAWKCISPTVQDGTPCPNGACRNGFCLPSCSDAEVASCTATGWVVTKCGVIVRQGTCQPNEKCVLNNNVANCVQKQPCEDKPGTTLCNGFCVDTTKSHDNCGGCGNKCVPTLMGKMQGR